MNISDYLENELINHILRNTEYVSPVVIYVGLFLTDPGEVGGTEVSGGSYIRQAVSFDAPVDGVSSNTSLVTFPTATADWGEIFYAALFDAQVGGNMLFGAPLRDAMLVQTTQTFSFLAGTIVVQFS